MNWNFEYGELVDDKDFVDKCENLKNNLIEVQKVIDQLLPLRQQYDKLSLPAKIELDLFFAYALNALQWVHLRIQGIDPSKHPIMDELERIKKVMQRWQQVKDSDKRPIVNIDAAKRFIKSALYDPYRGTAVPPNKKIKFNDDN